MDDREQRFPGHCRGRFNGHRQAREVLTFLLAGVTRRLDLLMPATDHTLHDNPTMHAAIRRLVRGGRHQPRVRILVDDPTPLVRRNHGLLQAVRGFPSAVEARRLAPEDLEDLRSFLLVDTGSYLLRDAGPGHTGRFDIDDRRTSTALTREFSDRWERAIPDPELRQMVL